MLFVSFDINSCERTSRTQVLTSSTTDTTLLVDHRYLDRIGLIGMQRYHLNGLHGAVTGTVATLLAIGHRHTMALAPYGMTNLNRRLVGPCDGSYRSCRAHFGTFCTLRTAIALFVGHHRLHHRQQVARGSQHLIRTYRYAELASGTMLRHVPQS